MWTELIQGMEMGSDVGFYEVPVYLIDSFFSLYSTAHWHVSYLIYIVGVDSSTTHFMETQNAYPVPCI